MNAILTREEILQSGIHHGTAALDYSHEGWGAERGWLCRLVFLCVLFCLHSDCHDQLTPFLGGALLHTSALVLFSSFIFFL